MMQTIFAHVYKHVLEMRHPAELAWVLIYPAIGILSIGIFAVFLATKGQLSTNPLFFVIAGALIWDFYALSQRAITYGMMFSVWDNCLKHEFVSKSGTKSFLIGNGIFGFLSSFVALVFVAGIAYVTFGFNLFSSGIHLLTAVFSTFIFATSVGILILSMMVRVNRSWMSMTWILSGVMMVISGVYYPVSILPAPLAAIANLLPTTHAIQVLRGALGISGVDITAETIYAFASSLILLAISLAFYVDSLKKGREKGNLVI